MRKCLFILLSIFLLNAHLFSQVDFYRSEQFTKADTLRGQLRNERTCYDVRHYNLTVDFDITKEQITGSNLITFDLISTVNELQIDLFENMLVESIKVNGKEKRFRRSFNAIFIDIDDLEIGKNHTVRIEYHGSPKRAITPPWDGGFQWTTDDEGNPWIHVSCQGIGASLWWPNKDHLSDEPDAMTINLIVPKPLMAVSNGDLISSVEYDEKIQYTWEVDYPINNYNVTFDIGNYDHFQGKYTSPEKGDLRCDYYVLPNNVEKAKKHFRQVNGVLEAFEYYLGPYPFWEDGYALVETPYLGMEHQSAIAYGNKFNRGYMGGMIPSHMNWDYLIVHETGHEYWGNAVSCTDNGELWIHESFCTYMEALYVEYHMGRKESIGYLATQKDHKNDYPIIGPLNVNYHHYKNSDHYFKGSWVLHTLRNAINEDDLFFSIIRTFYDDYKYKNASSNDFFNVVNAKTGKDYMPFFKQYLYHPEIPVLEYRLKEKGANLKVDYRWVCDVEEFDMQIKIGKAGKMTMVSPKVEKWKSLTLKGFKASDFQVATNLFLVHTTHVKGQ